MPGAGTRSAVPCLGLPLDVGQFPMTQAARLLLSATARVQEQLRPPQGWNRGSDREISCHSWVVSKIIKKCMYIVPGKPSPKKVCCWSSRGFCAMIFFPLL